LCIILCLCSCDNTFDTERQIRDKKQIAQGIIDNIEFERLSLQDDNPIFAKFDSISRQIDYTAAFARYAKRQLRNSNKYVFFTEAASTQIDAYTVKIYYSKDSLKCAALIVLDTHFDISPQFEDPESEHEYSGFAIYGVRNTIDKPFKIYPINSLTVMTKDGISVTKRILERVYNTAAISRCATAGTYMEHRDHKYWFGHNKFFEDSPDFKTDSAGIFWAEYIYHAGMKPVRKYLYSNRDDAYFTTDRQ
ncbi:MAG: hypothetical protein K2J10_00555, partial [Muribaculaceae bacterium]|nr:hypothetical protein [Muribaculaceae bacterium]